MSLPVSKGALSERYEDLRAEALGGARPTGRAPGCSIILRLGLWAWVEAASAMTPGGLPDSGANRELVPEKAELATLLAGLVLARGREVSR